MLTSPRLFLFAIVAVIMRRVRAMDETPGMQESSQAYLQNVVQELQLLNGIIPSASSADDQRTSGSQHSYVYESPAPPTMPSAPSAPVRFVESTGDRQVAIGSKFKLHPQVLPNNPTYLEEPTLRQPVVLGFTPAELAAMYRKAIERGTPMRYGNLVNAIDRQPPKIIAAPLELTGATATHHALGQHSAHGESQYAYYFYPLQTFRHELINDHGYKTMPDNVRYDSAPAENSKKETSTMNPILVGISSFLGMALFFMLSLFLYPRFVHYMHFPFAATSARTGWQDELAHLAAFATEAIDFYNRHLREKPKRSPYVMQKKKFQKRPRR